MYFVISRLDENKLEKLDFLVNFGVSLDNIHLMLDKMQNGGDYEDLSHTFAVIPFL